MKKEGATVNAQSKFTIIAKREVLNLPILHYEVLRFIFEEDKMNAEEVKLMQQSILRWKSHAEIKEDEDILYMLQMLAKILIDNEKGLWDKKKKQYKDQGIDWRKVYDLPGARTEEDRFQAQKHLEEWNRKNDYGQRSSR